MVLMALISANIRKILLGIMSEIIAVWFKDQFQMMVKASGKVISCKVLAQQFLE